MTRARIEGTSISLDSPEAIAKWIEDRKKRWPSNKVVEEKVNLPVDSYPCAQKLTKSHFEYSGSPQSLTNSSRTRAAL